jgi:hypothetical protein
MVPATKSCSSSTVLANVSRGSSIGASPGTFILYI